MADTGRTVFADGLFADDFWAAGLWAADEPVAVPDVDDPGTTQADAVLAIEGAGLVANVLTAHSSLIPVGEVISQDPAAGTLVAPGSTVTITVSLGDQPVDQQASGGWWPYWELEAERRRRRKKREEERERELAQIQADTDREIAALLRKQEAEQERQDELTRLQKLVDAHQSRRKSLELTERVEKAMAKAYAERSALALELFRREVETMLEEEDALLSLLLLDDED